MAVKNDNKLLKPGKSVKSVVKQARPKRGNTIGVFIDLDNTNASLDNVLEIFSSLKYKGEIVFGKFYGYTDSKTDEFDEFVSENRLDTIGRMRFKTEGVSVIDPRLVVDCIGFAEKNGADMIFVWAGVGDLIPLLSEVVKAGCKTITVDLPEFDCDNKFVDEKIKLFSPHSLDATSKTKKRQSIQSPEDDITDIDPDEDLMDDDSAGTDTSIDTSLLGDRKIPQLPRKKGAPDFGAKSESTFSDSADDDFYNDNKDYDDDFEDEDFNIDDEDDDDEDEEENNEDDIDDDGMKELDIYENLKAQEYMNELYLSIKAGQPIEKFLENLEKAEKERSEKMNKKIYSATAADTTKKETSIAQKTDEAKEPVHTGTKAPAETKASAPKKPADTGAAKSTAYSKAYDHEDEVKKPEEKKFQDFQSDFSDFGDL